MSNILPPPSISVPAVMGTDGKASDFTPVWRQWFVDLARIINISGGTTGAVGSSRLINTTAPLTGGGNLSADRTLSLGTQAAHTVLAGPLVGVPAAPAFRLLTAADLVLIGVSATITTAKLTGGGANGSMTFVNGILTAQTPAT